MVLLTQVPVHGSYVGRPAGRAAADEHRDGPDVRADHAARHRRREPRRRRSRLGSVQHRAAGRRLARPGDPLDARRESDQPACSTVATSTPTRRARVRLSRRVRGRRDHARRRCGDPRRGAAAPPRAGARARHRRPPASHPPGFLPRNGRRWSHLPRRRTMWMSCQKRNGRYGQTPSETAAVCWTPPRPCSASAASRWASARSRRAPASDAGRCSATSLPRST